jgi:hypothetical protein
VGGLEVTFLDQLVLRILELEADPTPCHIDPAVEQHATTGLE